MTMTQPTDPHSASVSADRLDELADTAELRGDEPTAKRLRERAHRSRLDELGRNDHR